MLLALMDEAYTGSTIGDGGADSESEDSNTMAAGDPLFLEILKDENDGLAVWCFLNLKLQFHSRSMYFFRQHDYLPRSWLLIC